MDDLSYPAKLLYIRRIIFMKAPFFLIEVFNEPALRYKGNTAAVVWLEQAMDDKKMQSVAADFNQPATTFLWPSSRINAFHVRWFAPDEEIGLCGHGSLAAVVFLSMHLAVEDKITLIYREGQIQGEMIAPNTCAIQVRAIPVVSEETIPDVLQAGLGIPVKAYFVTANKHIVLVESENELKDMQPDFAKLRASETFGYAVTAPGNEVDFVSRTLVPHVQQLEDPATGSSHAALAPFWGQRLGKKHMIAHQLSKRGGKFICDLENDHVKLSGSFSVLAKGELI